MFTYAIQIAIFFLIISYSAFFYLALRQMLTFRSSIWSKILSFLILLSISNAIVYPEELIGCLVFLAGMFFLVFVCCTGDIMPRICAVLIFYPLMIAINFMTEDLGFLIWLHIFHQNLPAVQESLLGLASGMLRIPFWYLVYRFTKSHLSQITENFTSYTWMILSVVCLASFVSVITVIYESEILTSYSAYPACFACIITNPGICILGSYLSRMMHAEMELQAFHYEKNYYQELEENQQQVRRLRHDMKNHLNVLSLMLQNHEEQNAEEYLSQLSEEFNTNLRPFCPDPILNAVLNSKYSLARKHQISCEFQIDIAQEIPLNSVALCSLFANSLDNAIEANQQISDVSLRRILLKARLANGFLSYELKNTKQNEIIQKGNHFVTGKHNHQNHGIGIPNIRNMVNRCGGTMEISYTDTEFTLTAFIPVNNKS